MSIKGCILVTGPASGIGKATVLTLAKRGFGVFATCMNKRNPYGNL